MRWGKESRDDEGRDSQCDKMVGGERSCWGDKWTRGIYVPRWKLYVRLISSVIFSNEYLNSHNVALVSKKPRVDFCSTLDGFMIPVMIPINVLSF
jgi:hypothetical protein